MRGKITKRTVDALEPGPTDGFVWDTHLMGFGCKITPAGKRVYIVQYRLGGRGAPTKRLTLGEHGELTPDEARAKAKRALGAVADGKDPGAEKKAKRQKGKTVAALCDEYLAQHVEPKNKASTAREFRRLVETHIKPRLGRLEVGKVARADVAKLHHEMRETPRQANQALAVLSKMFRLAEAWGLRPDGSNPSRLVQRYKETKRERFLSDAELARLGATLNEAESTKSEAPATMAAIRLAALTGCRVGELLRLQWDDIDAEQSALVIRDGKTGGRLHSIGAETLAFLAALPRREGCPWVLADPETNAPLSISALEHAWARIRKRAGLDDARLHDMRHTVGTFAGQTGANAFLVRDKLGHKTLAMTGRYVSRDADPMRALSDKVEGRIAAAMGNGAPADVVPLKQSS